MLSKEQNEALYRVGPGTPMGDLLRRYWAPIGAAAELDDKPVKPIRLMGEDLVLYKDLAGHYGLVDRHCPHRRADMSYGWVEECGIRCNYHGWQFDESGACTDQPFEEIAHPDARFKDRIKIKAYPVEAKAGLLWAYLGPPDKKPLVPNYEAFTRTNGFVQIVLADVPCNWFQCHENTIDPVHFEWLHNNWSQILRGQLDQPRAPTHVRLAFKEFEHGFTYHRILEGMPETHERWQIGRVSLWPHGFFLGGHFEWRIPVDDDNSLSVCWFFEHVPTELEPYHQARIPYWWAPLKDERTNRWITSHVINQDFVGWVGQGAVADRTLEHLGESDRGIIMLRRRMLEEAAKVARGDDPKGLVRDPAQNECIMLPTADLELLRNGRSMASTRQRDPFQRTSIASREFAFFAHQPEAVRQAYRQAMGLDQLDEAHANRIDAQTPA